MTSKVKIIERSNSIIYFFHELLLGKYEDGELSNFFIKSNNPNDEEIFIVTESNDEDSIVSFMKDSLPFVIDMDKVSDKDVKFDTTNFNITVLLIKKIDTNVEIKSIGVLEWLLGKLMFDDKATTFQSLSDSLSRKTFDLYVTNVDDLKNNFKNIINDENFHEILENEKF